MIFELTKNQFEFLIKLDNVEKYILQKSKKGGMVSFYVKDEDIDIFLEEMYYNVVDYGMDEEGAVNSYGREIYAVHDTLLYQASNA